MNLLIIEPPRGRKFIQGAEAVEQVRGNPLSILGKRVALVVSLKGVPGQSSETIAVDVLFYSWNERLNRGRFAGRVSQYSMFGDWLPGQGVRFQAGDVTCIDR